MATSVIIPAPLSKNIFEEYFRLIEKISEEVPRNLPQRYTREQLLNSLSTLDNLVSSIERSLQDINSSTFEKKEEISELTVELLNSWLLVLASWKSNPSVIEALIYNYIPIIFILENYSKFSFLDVHRYLKKLNSAIERSSKRLMEFQQDVDIATEISEMKNNEINFEIKDELSDLLNRLKSQKVKFDYNQIDVFNLSDAMEYRFISFADDIITRLINDTLKLSNLPNEIQKIDDAQKIRQFIKDQNLTEVLENLFFFDDSIEDAIWDVKVTISSATNEYNAAEIGFLMWSFSKGIESIDDIEVELVKWGDGSKWFNLKIKIKSAASKVDLKDVLEKSRELVEVAITKKPTNEIRKFKAEEDKLRSEANKIKKETAIIMDEKVAKLSQELSIQNQILDLQKKEVEIEDKKADVRLKNLTAIEKLSELIKNGIIQNDSNVEIMINDILYIEKTKVHVTYENIDLLDIGETIEPKKDDVES